MLAERNPLRPILDSLIGQNNPQIIYKHIRLVKFELGSNFIFWYRLVGNWMVWDWGILISFWHFEYNAFLIVHRIKWTCTSKYQINTHMKELHKGMKINALLNKCFNIYNKIFTLYIFCIFKELLLMQWQENWPNGQNHEIGHLLQFSCFVLFPHSTHKI